MHTALCSLVDTEVSPVQGQEHLDSEQPARVPPPAPEPRPPHSSRPTGAWHRAILSSTFLTCPSTLGTKGDRTPQFVLTDKMSLVLSKWGIHSADMSVRERKRPAKNTEQLSFPGLRGLGEGRGNGRSLFLKQTADKHSDWWSQG